LFYYIILTGSDRPVTYRSANANQTRPVTRPDRQPAPVDPTGFHRDFFDFLRWRPSTVLDF